MMNPEKMPFSARGCILYCGGHLDKSIFHSWQSTPVRSVAGHVTFSMLQHWADINAIVSSFFPSRWHCDARNGPRALRLVGLVVRVSASRATEPGFDSRLRLGDFPGSSHTSDLKIGTPVTIPCQASGVIGSMPGCCCCYWLLNVPATCKCISGTDLLRQFYVLPH